MAILSMSDTAYGRSASGRKALLTDLQSQIKSGVTSLTGDKYDAVIKAVNETWSGADATQFITKFKKSVSEIAAKCNKYNTTIQNCLDADAKQFSQMQSNNANNI